MWADAVVRRLGELLPEEEDIELVRLPLEAAIQRVMSEELSDAKTVTGLIAYRGRSRT